MPDLVRTGILSLGQDCQVRSGWSKKQVTLRPVMLGQF